MVRTSFMLIAGEPSGDILGAELAPLLCEGVTQMEGVFSPYSQPLHASLVPEFYGAGGPRMKSAGVDLAVDLTQHSVVGLWEVIRKYRFFRARMRDLTALAIRRQPDAIICIDFSGFNLRFIRRIRAHVRSLAGTFGNWRPRIVQYVSPQVWASRPQRASRMAEDLDLLLSIFPFERDWYAQRAPRLPVEYVGHPLVDRYAAAGTAPLSAAAIPNEPPTVLLLPGSRPAELTRHVPVMLSAAARMRSAKPSLRACMVVPTDELREMVQGFRPPTEVSVQTGGLAQVLKNADVAIASTGTVTLECAWFGVPTVAIYKTSRATFAVGKRLINVRHLAMPNLLAGEEVFPEFIQDNATAGNIAAAALDLLNDASRRSVIRTQLAAIVDFLGSPGASRRAANAILNLLAREPRPLRAALQT